MIFWNNVNALAKKSFQIFIVLKYANKQFVCCGRVIFCKVKEGLSVLYLYEIIFRHDFLCNVTTVFEIHRKSLIQTLRAKRATFTFWVDKSSLKMPKWSILASFWKPESCGQTVLLDRSILSRQKSTKNAKKYTDLASIWKLEACGQTVLLDRSI